MTISYRVHLSFVLINNHYRYGIIEVHNLNVSVVGYLESMLGQQASLVLSDIDESKRLPSSSYETNNYICGILNLRHVVLIKVLKMERI